LLGAAQLRRLAAAIGLTPSKSLGQNFLHDANTVRRIVRTAALEPVDAVLEIGPGLGSLTLGLLPACASVTAVEVDPRLADLLPSTVEGQLPAHASRLTVITADALTLQAIPGAEPTALVANLPYNVAVPVLLHVLELLPSVRHGLVMVQSEVGDRLAAAPGSKVYGVPSAKAAWYSAVRKAGSVPRQVFWPVPNVDSSLVAFIRRDPPPGDRRDTFAVIDAAFSQRRKTLRVALSEWAGSASAAERVLAAAGVDPKLRGEALDIGAFARIAVARTGHSGGED